VSETLHQELIRRWVTKNHGHTKGWGRGLISELRAGGCSACNCGNKRPDGDDATEEELAERRRLFPREHLTLECCADLRLTARRLVPDAWRVREGGDDDWGRLVVEVLEVQISNPISREKLSTLCELFWALDSEEIQLRVYVADRTETVREVDIFRASIPSVRPRMGLPWVAANEDRELNDEERGA
jgi:hypothetical protein